jgi:proteic killer suppression protein
LIRSFRHRGLQRLHEEANRKGLPAAIVPKIERVLARLDVAHAPEMMNLPGFRLHPLKGKRKGYWSVWVSGNWRIVFRFDGNDVRDVELLDYH